MARGGGQRWRDAVNSSFATRGIYMGTCARELWLGLESCVSARWQCTTVSAVTALWRTGVWFGWGSATKVRKRIGAANNVKYGTDAGVYACSRSEIIEIRLPSISFTHLYNSYASRALAKLRAPSWYRVLVRSASRFQVQTQTSITPATAQSARRV